MDVLANSLSLLDDFLVHSSTRLGNDLGSEDNSQAIFQSLQQVAGYKNQSELADYVANNPKWAETFVSFAVLVFEGTTKCIAWIIKSTSLALPGHFSAQGVIACSISARTKKDLVQFTGPSRSVIHRELVGDN